MGIFENYFLEIALLAGFISGVVEAFKQLFSAADRVLFKILGRGFTVAMLFLLILSALTAAIGYFKGFGIFAGASLFGALEIFVHLILIASGIFELAFRKRTN